MRLAFKKILFTTGIILLCLSCKKVLYYDFPYDGPQLVLNAQWHTCDTIHYAYLCQSEQYMVRDVDKDLSLTCRINNNEAIAADSSWAIFNGSSFISRCYQFKVDLHPGDSVVLNANNDLYSLKAQSVVLPVPTVSIDTSSVRKLFNDYLPYREYDVNLTLTDRKGESNYYQAFSLAVKTTYEPIDDSSEDAVFYNRVLLNDSDPVFRSVPLQIPSSLANEVAVFASTTNRAHVFSDDLFEDGCYALSFTGVKPVLLMDSAYISFSTTYTLRLAAISWDSYLYCLESNASYSSSGDPFSEPVLIPTNVEGGLGSFGVYSVYEFQFNDWCAVVTPK